MIDKDPLILYSHTHGYWWSGNAKELGLGVHDIDCVFSERSGLSTDGVNWQINYDDHAPHVE